MTTLQKFDAAKVTITRKRFSVTQGEVLIEYAGQKIEQYGDRIELVTGGEYVGRSDAYWLAVAEREAIKRGLALDTAQDEAAPAREQFEAVRRAARITGNPDRVALIGGRAVYAFHGCPVALSPLAGLMVPGASATYLNAAADQRRAGGLTIARDYLDRLRRLRRSFARRLTD